jgi:DNA-binding LacI/PurR family transcriptional regulator
MIEQHGITALLGANDEYARYLYYKLLSSGFRVPGDFSMVSFDNYPDLLPLPVSSVDFGFGHLGYMAFHAILQDITVKRGRRGDIPARAIVVHRGSVAPPPGSGTGRAGGTGSQ